MTREIDLNPGHRDAINKFLNESDVSYTPDDLAAKAEAAQKIEDVLYILRQELGNTAMLVDGLELIIWAIEDEVNILSDENVSTVLSYLEEYVRTTKKGLENTKLILECIRLIEEADKRALEADKASILTGESSTHIEVAVRNFERIQNVLSKNKKHFDKAYTESLKKVQDFLAAH